MSPVICSLDFLVFILKENKDLTFLKISRSSNPTGEVSFFGLNQNILMYCVYVAFMGRSKISEKGVHMCKGVGVHFADFVLFFIKYPMKME